MGIINANADSFFPDSRACGEAAVEKALEMVEDGADIIDVGGESTRPGATPVGLDEELRRVIPVIEGIAKRSKVQISVDTTKSGVAERALQSGASMLNDVSALRGDCDMIATARKFEHVIMMHMLGEPGTMQNNPKYNDVVTDIKEFFKNRLDAFGTTKGVILDPGIGFGKTLEHNLEIFRRLEEFHELGCDLLIGASRKSFIGKLLGSEERPLPVEDRLEGSIAAALRAASAHAAIVRVHDVQETRRALSVFKSISPRPAMRGSVPVHG